MKIKYKTKNKNELIFVKLALIFLFIFAFIFIRNCFAEEKTDEITTETTSPETTMAIETAPPETEVETTIETVRETELQTELETNPIETELETEAEITQIEITEEKAAAPLEDPVLYFDVPLGEDLQDHIFELCESYNVDPAIVVAMIERESGFRPAVKGDNGRSYGLMQIQLRYHKERMKKLGVTDLLNPYQNVAVGIDLLAELSDSGNPIEWVLMAYNGGYAYANRNISVGTVSNYAKAVLTRSEELKKGMI